MNKVSHYKLAISMMLDLGFGFTEAELIGWADESVDKAEAKSIRRIMVQGKGLMVFPITQEYKAMTISNIFSRSALELLGSRIWIPFHFFTVREDLVVERMTILELLRIMKVKGLSVRDLIKGDHPDRLYWLVFLGLCLHVQQDTYAHESFIGLRDDRNSVFPGWHPKSFMPNIGHAELPKPVDDPYARWLRTYHMKTKVNNKGKWEAWMREIWQDLSTEAGKVEDTETWKVFQACKTESQLGKALSRSIKERTGKTPRYKWKLAKSMKQNNKYYLFLRAARTWLALYNRSIIDE